MMEVAIFFLLAIKSQIVMCVFGLVIWLSNTYLYLFH
jgi:hypothetical protein